MTHAPSLTPPLTDYNPPMEPYLNVIHADEHILLVDKPAGLLSVPGKSEDHRDCLEFRAQQQFDDARIVHRLDMDTSGIMILALNHNSHRNLGRQFEKRIVKKRYLARVWGNVEADSGVVDLPLICDWPNRPKQMVCHERGKAAKTEWQVLARDARSTLVALTPHTGRSHQLRVHMLSLGHPILGDRFYASGDALSCAPRLMLHAEQLDFIHPATGDHVCYKADCSF